MKKALHNWLRNTTGFLALFFIVTTSGYGQLTPACSPSYNSGSFNWNISNITIGSLNQNITYNNHDYTDQSFEVVAGESNPISLTSNGYCSVGVAGDWNNDGDFDDSGEVMNLVSYEAGAPQVYNFEMTVPANVLAGSYRFRAWNIYANSGDGTPVGSPCGTYGYGSWFDMTIDVTSAAACQPPSAVTVDNVQSTSVEASWTAPESTPENYVWSVFNMGDDPEVDIAVATGSLTDESVTVTDLSSSTEYQFYIMSNCGVDGNSFLSNPVSFYTLCEGTPVAGTPSSLVSAVCSGSSFTLTFDEVATSGPGISYQWQSSPAGEVNWVDIEDETEATLSLSQDESTDYRYYVICSGSDESDTSAVLNIGISPANECYCTPGNSNMGFSDEIVNVTFAGIDNSSSGADDNTNGYADYTTTVAPADVLPGLTYDFSATTGSGGNEFVSIWIDYNFNGEFETSEHSFIGNGNNVTVSSEITIPFGTAPGTTRMRVRLKYSSQVGASNPCNAYTYGETEDYLVTIQALEPCEGTPEPGLTFASTDSVCGGGAIVDFSLEDNYTTVSEIEYQWLINTGSGWSAIENDTLYYSSYNVTETSWFRCELTCVASGLSEYSDSTLVDVIQLPEVVVDPSGFALCEGGSAVLNASGAETYIWSPETGLTATSGASVQANPTSSTTYTVTGTDEYGCVNSALATVAPIGEIAVAAVPNETAFCEPGNLVTVSLEGVPDGISGGGNWSYQWVDGDGNEVQPYSPISNFATTPAEVGNYSYAVNMVASSCNEDTLFNIGMVNFTVGFGAESALTMINCNQSTGIISLQNAFGLLSDSLIYSNDFSVPFEEIEGDSISLSGQGHMEDGRLVLTNSQSGVQGSFYQYMDVPANFAGFDLSFDLTADQPINNYGTGGGDGLAFSFGDDIETVGTNNLHNGSGSKLRLVFDAADNNPNQKGIYLVYGYSTGNHIPPTDPNVVAFSSNMGWKIQTDLPVQFSISAQGMATLTVGGVIIFNGVEMPEAYMNADKSDWITGFSAKTGGDALRHAVDNVEINLSVLEYGISAESETTPPSEWQINSQFTDLEEGTYNVWMNSSEAGCNSMVGTYTIENINPLIEITTPINICAGDSAVIDAGNPGDMYTWSTGDTTQTITVTEAGNYAILVTDSASCFDLASVAVNITNPSNVEGISSVFVEEGTYLISAVNPTYTDTYNWDFGDGETAVTQVPSIEHTYDNEGNFTVTLTVSSDFGCSDATVEGSVDVVSGIEETAAQAGFSVYPNPASSTLFLSNTGKNILTQIQIMDAAGKLVEDIAVRGNDTVEIDVNALRNGIYILRINAENAVYHTRFIIAK